MRTRRRNKTRRKGGVNPFKYLASLLAVQQPTLPNSTHVVASHNSTNTSSSVYTPKEVWVDSPLDTFDGNMMKTIEEQYVENARSSVKLANLFEGESSEKVFFTINGKRIETAFRVGKYNIDILPTIPNGERTCVSLLIAKKQPMYLSNFYFYSNMHQCPTTSHADIFNVFDAISSVYKTPIYLTDLSTKQVRDHYNCIFSNFVMAMAKDRTFYNIYGFQNKAFTEALNKTQSSKLTSVFDKKLALLYKKLSNSDDDVSFKQAAIFATKNCHHADGANMQIFINKLEIEIERQLKKYGLKDLYEFTRPTSENEYTVRVTKENDHYEVEFVTLAESIW